MIKEDCGVVAVYSKKNKDVAPAIYKALLSLQHRGQDAAGMAIWNGEKIEFKKGIGLVSEVFSEDDLNIKGRLGIGHVRYPTTPTNTTRDVQPTIRKDIAIAHNGHLSNYEKLREELEKKFEFLGTVDSEPLAMILEEEGGLEKGVKKIFESVDGAYSTVVIYRGKLAVFRDPHGIRPFVWGESEDYIIFASESVALDINEVEYKGKVPRGSLIEVNEGKIKEKKIKEGKEFNCMFEYVYFSRPDSIIEDKSVFEVRKKLGEILAEEHPVNADVVVPVPDTSRTAAWSFSKKLGIRLEEGLIKNRYVGRTFIMPTQEERKKKVRIKLNPVKEVIKGKRIVLVDDSIVRSTTIKEIIKMVRKAGAIEVHVRITSPPIKAPCFYGVDFPTYKELIASNKEVEEIKKEINADSLGYISISGLKKAIGLPICTACLNEEYPTKAGYENAKRVKEWQ